MSPFVLFNIQFVFVLIAYVLAAMWYVAPRLSLMSRQAALVPLLWVHVFRIAGGIILAPGSVEAAVPDSFRTAIGYGDMFIGVLALISLIALRMKAPWAVAFVWIAIVLGMLDTANAFIQSLSDNIFVYALGLNWVIVTLYVPALLVSGVMIFRQLLRRDAPVM